MLISYTKPQHKLTFGSNEIKQKLCRLMPRVNILAAVKQYKLVTRMDTLNTLYVLNHIDDWLTGAWLVVRINVMDISVNGNYQINLIFRWKTTYGFHLICLKVVRSIPVMLLYKLNLPTCKQYFKILFTFFNEASFHGFDSWADSRMIRFAYIPTIFMWSS